MFFSKYTLILIVFFLTPLSYGRDFVSSYVTFKIAENWTCKSFGVDWICHHYFSKGQKPGFILVTAKEGKIGEDLNLYFQNFVQNQKTQPEIKMGQVSIFKQTWFDVFLKHYFYKGILSRYLATVCCDDTDVKINIFIGFHASEENYAKYSNPFLLSIKSLKLVKNVKETLRQIRSQTQGQKTEMISYLQKILFEEEQPSFPNLKKQRNFSLRFLVLFTTLLFLFMFILYLLFFKKKRRKRYRKIRMRQRKKCSR